MHGFNVAGLFRARSACETGQKAAHHNAGKNNNGLANRRSRKRRAATVSTILGLKRTTQEKVLTVGRLMLHLTLLTYASAFLSPQWVCRVYDQYEGLDPSAGKVDPMHGMAMNGGEVNNTTAVLNAKNLYCFGLWTACDDNGRCDDVWNVVPGVKKAMVKWTQVLATMVLLGYVCAALLDAASRLTLCVCLAYNRVVENVLAHAAVMHFLTLLYQTGEVKNRAIRAHKLRDSPACGFALSISSLVLAVVSTCLMALFRFTPPAYKHRRFWKMPAELRPRNYLLAAAATGCGGGGGGGVGGGGWGGGGGDGDCGGSGGGGGVAVKKLGGGVRSPGVLGAMSGKLLP
ncbi:hypothetical protein ACOMHN_063609 [Nucella lapillus]